MKIWIFRGQGSENIDSTDLLIYWFTDLSIQNLAQIHTKSIQNDIKNQPKIYPKSIENSSQIVPKSIKNPIQIDHFGVLAWELDFSSILDASWAPPGPVRARLRGVLGCLGCGLEASWGRLGASWGVLGTS